MAKVLIESGLRLDIHRLVRSNAKAGHGDVWCSWAWWRGDERQATISYRLVMQGDGFGHLYLRFNQADEPVEQKIYVHSEPCRFGGVRWFASCPRSGRKAAKLYCLSGSKGFWSRKLFAHCTAYASQQEAPGFARTLGQRDRLLGRKLKGDDTEFIMKPKWMRWKTFDRLMARYEVLDGSLGDMLAHKIARLAF